MEIEQFYIDNNIDYLTGGNKHCSEGWINIHCLFCAGSESYHLGYNIESNFFKCWRCGFHHRDKVFAHILKIKPFMVKDIIKDYGLYTVVEKKVPIVKKRFKFPTNTTELKSVHIKYIEKRGFNVSKLVEQWNIKATGPFSELGKASYANRIIIPIKWEGQIVSFQGRTIGIDPIKYKACIQEREFIEHQKILYGDQTKWGDTIILVEGVADVWRFGPEYAIACFGIDFSHAQVRLISKNFKKVYVMFDNEPQAIIQAEKMVGELRFRGIESKQIILKGNDPGDMSDSKAQKWINKLFKK